MSIKCGMGDGVMTCLDCGRIGYVEGGLTRCEVHGVFGFSQWREVETFRDGERRAIDGAARADALTGAAKAVLEHEHRGGIDATFAFHTLRDSIIAVLANPESFGAWLMFAGRLREAAVAASLPELERLAERVELVPLPRE